MIFRIYSFCLFFYRLYIQIASLFSAKARLWIDGRKEWRAALTSNTPSGGFDLWMHCSSLGEFEQGRPILESFKEKNPKAKILLSFYSPSGYEIRKNYSFADYVCYLPFDSSKNAKSWLELSKPKQIIFVKYDFWFHFLNEIKNQGIKCILVSANFSEKSFFNTKLGKFFIPILEAFNAIFFQEEPSFKLPNVIEQFIVGDTRIDRVIQIQKEAILFDEIETWKGNSSVMIWGSVWPEDFIVLRQALDYSMQDWKHIIAPHEPNRNAINAIQSLSSSNYKLFSSGNFEACKTVIIDSVGKLSSLYRYGDLAFIGGGFGKGIHNTLEPLAAGCPVFFGPNYKKFPEAIKGIEYGCSFSINSKTEFDHLVLSAKKENNLAGWQQKSLDFIQSRKGATSSILDYLTL